MAASTASPIVRNKVRRDPARARVRSRARVAKGKERKAEHTTASFSHLGPIDHADLALRPITILSGSNNTGKSYISKALYGLLSARSNRDLYVANIRSSRYVNHPIFTTELEAEFAARGVARLTMDANDYTRHAAGFLAHLSTIYSKRLGHVFNLDTDCFNGSQVGLAIADGEVRRGYESLLDNDREFSDGKCIVKFKMKPRGRHAHLVVEIRLTGTPAASGGKSHRSTAAFLDGMLFLPALPSSHLFSAERARIGQFRHALAQEDGESPPGESQVSPWGDNETQTRLTLPVSDNAEFMQRLGKHALDHGGQLPDSDGTLHLELEHLFRVRYYFRDGEIWLQSLPGEEYPYDIPLHAASSSVREMTLLYFYLKYFAEPHDLVFIDEPEAHLDPRNQVRFAQMIANFANIGMRFFITTHSDFIVKEFSHLLMLNSSVPRKLGFYKLFPRYEGQQTIAPDMLGAYTCANRKLIPCQTSAYGVQSPVFDSIISDMNNVSMTLDDMVTDGNEH